MAFTVIDVTMSNLTQENAHLGNHQAAIDLVRALAGCAITTVDVGPLATPWSFELAYRLGMANPDIAVMAQCPLDRSEITHVREALKAAPRSRLGLLVPTAAQAVRGLRWPTYTDLIAAVEQYIQFGARLGLDVDVILKDASVTDPLFAGRLAQRAVAAGAAGVTLSVASSPTAQDLAALVGKVARAVPGTRIGLRCRYPLANGAAMLIEALNHGVVELGAVAAHWADDQADPSLEQLTGAGLLQLAPETLLRLKARVHTLISPAELARLEAAAGSISWAQVLKNTEHPA